MLCPFTLLEFSLQSGSISCNYASSSRFCVDESFHSVTEFLLCLFFLFSSFGGISTLSLFLPTVSPFSSHARYSHVKHPLSLYYLLLHFSVRQHFQSLIPSFPLFILLHFPYKDSLIPHSVLHYFSLEKLTVHIFVMCALLPQAKHAGCHPSTFICRLLPPGKTLVSGIFRTPPPLLLGRVHFRSPINSIDGFLNLYNFSFSAGLI